MALKLIHTEKEIPTDKPGRVAKVYRDMGLGMWGEYRVRLWTENGKENTEATYYTDDKSDALSTARHMAGNI